MVGLSVIACVMLCEVVIRLFFPQRLYYNVSQWDPDVGWTEIPNIRSVQRNLEYDMTIRINSGGLRDREFSFSRTPRTVRIGAFGDSFTFGEGVEAEQTWAKRVEQMFAKDSSLRAAGWRIEVLNFGIGKTGTSNQLAWYLKEGVHYGLDIVVLGFFVGNDFTDNVSGVYHLSHGQLVHDRVSDSWARRTQAVLYALPGYRWLAEHSQVLNLGRVAATRLSDRTQMAHALQGLQPSDGGQDAYAVELTRKLIQDFADSCHARGTKFLMLYLPARDERPLSEYRIPSQAKIYEVQLASLQRRLQSAPIESMDFVSVFAKRPSKAFYYAIDGHWRPAGHELVARALHERLKDEVLERSGLGFLNR